MAKKKGGAGKNKSQPGDDYWDDPEAMEQDAALAATAAAGTDGVDVAATNAAGDHDASNAAAGGAAAVAAGGDDDDEDADGGGGGLMDILSKQRNKRKGKQAAAPTEAAATAEAAGTEGSTIKSKKEKEKERKERLKLQQKQKKAAAKGSKADKEPAVTEPAAVEPDTAGKAPPATAAKGGKKKAAGPPVAALREFLAAKQAQEAEERRLEEERVRAEEERIRRIEEEERLREQAREAKRERDRLKKEQLKREGKFVSEAERRRRQLNQLKLEQLKSQGVTIAALDDSAAADSASDAGQQQAPPPATATGKRIVYDSKKKKKKQQATQEVAAPEPEAVPEQEAAPKQDEEPAAEATWEDVADSWENLDLDDDEATTEADKDTAKPAKDVDKDDTSDQDGGDSGDSDSDSDDEEESDDDQPAKSRAAQFQDRRRARLADAMAKRSAADLRSPICVILGHVDTGKTKLLDKIRQTNVQEGEAGGITQQIGATYFPAESIVKKTQVVRDSANYAGIAEKSGFRQDFEVKVPGLLIIDTPGHESFTNLRSRGSSLCNIAILVVDIMHGLEPQTIESIGLLKKRKTPFIVALNKIDRIYGWQSISDNSFNDSIKQQPEHVVREFEDRMEAAKTAFAEQGLNAELFTRNPDVRKYVSLVPTSAITGEGIPDLLALLIQLTQDRLTDSLMYLSELEATVLEVKVIDGHGTTIDVILSNGVLHEGDRIVLCGLNGAIVTQIRALLTPQPLRELRVKSAYVHHKEIKAAMGVKISAPDLDKAIAGSRLMVVTDEDDEEEMKEEVMSDLVDLFESVDKSGRGVCVQASTIGSLEALLSFLKDSKIPVAGINIGPVHRKDIIRASVMLEHAREFATILAFDVKVDRDAQEMADSMGIRIFCADIIYHLFDQFTRFMANIKEERKRELSGQAVWPCILRIVPGCVFNKKDPIILGVDVVEGNLRLDTPVCIPSRGTTALGKIAGIEANKKPIEQAKRGQQVSVRIEGSSQSISYGRHFAESDEIVSKISRQSIDVLKECFRDEVTRDEWLLIKKLKTLLQIN